MSTTTHNAILKTRTRIETSVQETSDSLNEFQFESYDPPDDLPACSCGTHAERVDNCRISSVLRRFPALRKCEPEEIRRILRLPPNFLSSPASRVEKPRIHRSLQHSLRSQSGSSASYPSTPFVPSSASQAKRDITDLHSYVNAFSPYAASHQESRRQQQESVEQRVDPDKKPFWPISPAQAKATIRANYFLTSADAETLSKEKEFITERCRRSRDELRKTLRPSRNLDL